MGWMRVVERRTSSIAHGDDHATRRRSAAQRRPTDRRTTHTTDDDLGTTRTGATTSVDAPRPPRVVLDAYCLRIYKYEAGISNIYPEVGGSRGGATHGHTDACVRGPRACARWMGWLARARARARGDGDGDDGYRKHTLMSIDGRQCGDSVDGRRRWGRQLTTRSRYAIATVYIRTTTAALPVIHYM